MNTTPALPDVTNSKPEMPTVSRSMSANSRFYKKVAVRALFFALLLTGVSTIVSAFHGVVGRISVLNFQINLTTGIASVLFLGAVGIRLYRIIRNPERIWYGSRSLAEQTYAVNWDYAVGGKQFPLPDERPAATEQRLHSALDQATQEATEGGIFLLRGIKPDDHAQVITPWMRGTRGKPLDFRRAVYAEHRIKYEEDHYRVRALQNYRSLVVAQWFLVIIEVLGATAAGLNAVGILSLDLVGVAGTIAAAVTAWTQFQQYAALTGAYSAMQFRMAGYYERCTSDATVWTDANWAMFVAEVEDALAAEHSAWKSLRERAQ